MREQSLPGIGQRFEIDIGHDRRLVVIAARDGGRTIGVARADDDDLDGACTLTADQAFMAGALLLGARFSVDTRPPHGPGGDHVTVETVTIPTGAPSIGRRPSAVVESFGDDVVVLGIVRDVTPEVVEADPDAPLAPGDRVAIAGRPGLIAEATRSLTG